MADGNPDFFSKKDHCLDKSDAQYVQCVYTAASSFGTYQECGDGDFFMNNGRRQPGCTPGNILCFHSMAQEYFSEAMLPNHIFEGPDCEEGIAERFGKEHFWARILLMFDEMLRDCDHSKTDRMGIHTNKIKGRFFVVTNSEDPYAKRIL